jgi:hypothetical protein
MWVTPKIVFCKGLDFLSGNRMAALLADDSAGGAAFFIAN